MAIKVGDKVTKASVINSFHETVKTNIYRNFPVNQTNLPRKLPMISYAFNNPNATNLVNNLSGQPVATQVATMYQNFINLVSAAKVIYYYETHGNWTNGGRLTYTTDFQTTYKGIMSSSNTNQLGWTNGEPRSNRGTEGFGRNSTQPKYYSVNVPVQNFFNSNNVKRGQPISVANFYNMFNALLTDFNKKCSAQAINLTYTSCHSNCHSSCHHARSRR